jgi:CBS domain-containing protein
VAARIRSAQIARLGPSSVQAARVPAVAFAHYRMFVAGMRDAPSTAMPIATTLRARDFMQTELLTVTPETSIIDIHKLFIEEEIHGAPVVDDMGVVRGVVSTLDLLRAVNEEVEPDQTTQSYFRSEWSQLVDELPGRLREVRASDIMTRELVAVRSDTSIVEVARIMREQHVHRVLVIDDRELLGVVTTFDLLRAFVDDTFHSTAIESGSQHRSPSHRNP